MMYILQGCVSLAVDTPFSRIFSQMNMILSSLVPFCVLVVLNIGIVHAVLTRKKFISGNHQKEEEDCSQRPTTSQKEVARERQLTMMLILVSVMFLVFTLPMQILIILRKIPDVRSPQTFGENALTATVLMIFYQSNFCCNFFLYCVSGKKFRQDLVHWVLFIQNKMQSKSFVNSHVTQEISISKN